LFYYNFIKILSYLLENREVQGKTALQFFREKITDPAIFANTEKAVTTGTKDVILFNIYSKANTANKGDEQIVNIFMRAFNDRRGYLGDVFWIADLEEVHRILNLEEPYSKIKNLRALETRIETSIKTALSSQKEKVREKLSGVREAIEKALSKESSLREGA
jgi:hypothetical protein